MKEELIQAIKSAATKTAAAKSPDEALKYSQAALNAAHALATVVDIQSK